VPEQPLFDDPSGRRPDGRLDALEAAFGADIPDEEPDIEHPDGAGSTYGQMDDAALARYVARATSNHGREQLTAISALAQQMEIYHPLSATEQAEKLAVYRAGVAASARLESGKLSGREQRTARTAARQGEYAQTELVGSMFRLVLIIAREIAAERYGAAKALDMLEDLVGEANVALVQSVADYDERKCPTFAIYAGRVIRDRVRMSLQKQSALGVAPSWLRLKRIYTVRVPELEMALGRKPTEVEIKADLRRVCMEWAAKKLTDADRQLPLAEQHALMEAKLRKQGMLGAIDKLQEVLITTHQVSSLDSPLAEESGSTLGDLLAGPTDTSTFADPVEFAELSRDLQAALATLPEREREIMLYRFGFYPPPPDAKDWTYVKLAPKYGVSAERVRQIERNVLAKLRGPGFTNLSGHLPSQLGDTAGADGTDGTDGAGGPAWTRRGR